MKEFPKICLTIFGLIFIFIVLYNVQNPECNTQLHYSESNNQLQSPKVGKWKFKETMNCLEHGFYFIQKFYTSFTEMWNHYSIVIEVGLK